MTKTKYKDDRAASEEGYSFDAAEAFEELMSRADPEQLRVILKLMEDQLNRLGGKGRPARMRKVVGERESSSEEAGVVRPARSSEAIVQPLEARESLDDERFGIGGGGSVSLPGVSIGVGISVTSEALEKIVGVNNLTNIAWLRRGLELARLVARVRTPDGFGTGFLIGRNLLMTNNHVLPDAETAAASFAQFNYEADWVGNPLPVTEFRITADGFRTNAELDYSIVRTEGLPGDEFGFLDLADHALPVKNGYATIIQHPRAGFKQIALTDNHIKVVHGSFVQYLTDTEPGSSGSAVFDDRWRLVALHHKGGDLPNPATGGTHFINQGVLINSIVNDARELITLPDLLADVVLGDLQPVLLGAISSREVSVAPLVPALTAHQRFARALDRWILMNMGTEGVTESQEELAPLLAAAAGVAAGAAIRHWGRRNESQATEGTKKDGLKDFSRYMEEIRLTLSWTERYAESQPVTKPSKELMRLIADIKATAQSAKDLYAKVAAKAGQVKDLVRNVLGSVGRAGSTTEALPVLAAAFLAGVAAGAAAYDGR